MGLGQFEEINKINVKTVRIMDFRSTKISAGADDGGGPEKERHTILEKVIKNMSKLMSLQPAQTEEKSEFNENSGLLKSNKLESLDPKGAHGNGDAVQKSFGGEKERNALIENSIWEHKQRFQHGEKLGSSGSTGKSLNGYNEGEEDRCVVLEELKIIKKKVAQQAEVIELLEKKFKSLEPKDNIQKLRAVQKLFTDKKEERCKLLEKIKKLKKQMIAKPGFKEDLEMLEKKLEGLESVGNTNLTLEAVKKVLGEEDKRGKGSFARDSIVKKEDEILTILEKIHKGKTQLSEYTESKPGAKEDLELLELKLKGLQLQLPRCSQKSQIHSKGNSTEAYSYSRFLSKETQTDSSLDAFWQISARENSVNDQIWFLLDRKTKMDVKEASLKKKEEELKRREEALLSESKSTTMKNDHVDNIVMHPAFGAHGEYITLSRAQYANHEKQFGSAATSRGDDKSYKSYRYNNGYNKYKFKSVNYVSNGGSNSKVDHKSVQK